MLTRLKVVNYLLIEELDLDFESGFTVVTGETGSGKSIIIDALMILFGQRTSPDVIRPAQMQAIFEAEFELTNSTIIEWLEENDLSDEDNKCGLLCRRVIDRNGKSKIYVNGNAVTVSQIKYIGEYILDVHTQHASITLLKQDIQRKLLDEFSGVSEQVQQITLVFKKVNELEYKINSLIVKNKEQDLNKLYLLEMLNELKQLELKDNEWHNLELQHKQLSNANLILQELDVVNESMDSIIKNNIAKLRAKLEKLEQIMPECNKIISLMESIDIEVVEVIHEVNSIVAKIEQDPQKLSEVEDRINLIFDMGRKYKINPEQITETIKITEERLLSLQLDQDIELLNEMLTKENKKYNELALKITSARKTSASTLSNKISTLLHSLSINGEFSVNLIDNGVKHSFGVENIEYNVCFNKGMEMQPLSKVASGGELSRTALALYLLLSTHNPPEIIIFDEIDVGIGGKIAAIVGQMLKELGTIKQVICITHQPQTASFGDNHIVVSKNMEDTRTKLSVAKIDANERIIEIARMLSGINVTDATIKHAEDMLKMN